MNIDLNFLRAKGVKPINDVLNESIDVIERKRRGEEFGFITRWSGFNKNMGGGIPFNTTLTIAARPSVGKSAFANLMVFDIATNHKNDVIILYWTFEMPGYQQGIRFFSSKIAASVQEITAGSDSPLLPETFDTIKLLAEENKDLDIFFIDIPKNVEQIEEIIMGINKKYPKYRIVNVFDHTRLIIGSQYDKSEEAKIFNLMSLCNRINKTCNSTNIVLSQLNRKVEDDLTTKVGYRRPGLGDIFGADAVAQFSNIVLTLHRPEIYGVDKYEVGLDRFNNVIKQATKQKLYIEICKNRDGNIGTLIFTHNLAINNIEQDLI